MAQAPSDKQRFGRACIAAIEESGRSAADVAKKLGFVPSMFTKWKKGMWTYIERDKLVSIVREIHPDDYRKQVDLIGEYLADLTPGEFRPTLLLGQKGENESAMLRRPMVGPGSNWSEDMRRRLDAVAAAYELDADYAAMVDHIVHWGKRLSTAQKRG